jgi:hypothetical protein
MALKLKRGTAESLSTIIPAEGELVYTTDTKRLYIGDGVTVGGISVDLGAVGVASMLNAEASANFALMAAGDGFTGSRGATGFVGSRGFNGSRGENGFAGSRGANGIPGFGGSRGFNGSQGFAGSRGFTGSTGAGFTGSRGYVGSAVTGYTGSAGVGYTGSAGLVGYTGSAGSGGGGSVSSLNNGTKALSLDSTGILTFPDNALIAPTGTDFSIKTDTGIAVSAVVTTPGSGFTVSGTSATTGGSGTGLTVRYSVNGSGGVRGVEIVNPGSAYTNGNVLTLSVGTGATITLSVGLTTSTWTFGKNGTTTFPNKLNFGLTQVGDGVEGNALILASSKPNITDIGRPAIIIPETGTQANPFATDLRLFGGAPYKTPTGNEPQAPGGNVLIAASGGRVGGEVSIMGGHGWSAGGVFIESGSADPGGPATGITNKGFGGIVGITGGFGYQEGGHVRIAAGDVAGNVPASNGRGGDVDITAGDSGTTDTNGGRAGNVILTCGMSKTATAIQGKVIVQTRAFGNEGYNWYFNGNGTMTFPMNSAPAHSYGKAGDREGMVAFADGYIYYCTNDYVNATTDIWVRVELGETEW